MCFPSQYQEVLKVKEVRHDGTRYIVCLNEEEAQRDKEAREEMVKLLREKLSRGGVRSLVEKKELPPLPQGGRDEGRVPQGEAQRGGGHRASRRGGGPGLQGALAGGGSVSRAQGPPEVEPVHH